MYYQPTPISWGDYNFLIMSAPDNSSMQRCIKDLEKFNVKHLICSCEKTYDEKSFVERGITVTELAFPDGQLPGNDVIDKWLKIVD